MTHSLQKPNTPAVLNPVPAGLSLRGEIRMGFRCNARCGFCYYQDLLDNPEEKEPTTERIYQQLRVLRQNGANEVEFTGGEPTIKADLAKVVGYAKDLGFGNVSLITNGLRLAKRSYLEKLVDAGVSDILFSVHGHTAELHDLHTAIPGSFEKIMLAMSHAQAIGVRTRTSTTVTSQNYLHLDEMLAFFINQGADCINLAVFSPVAQAGSGSTQFEISYSTAANALKQAISRHRSALPPLSVKYIPFCFMTGFEEYVMNLYQQSYDPDDWNYYFSNKVRRTSGPITAMLFDLLSLSGALLSRSFANARQDGLLGLKVAGFTRLVELLRKKRLPVCKDCSYDLICDHVWRNYARQHDAADIKPIPGTKHTHPGAHYLVASTRTTGTPLRSGKKYNLQTVGGQQRAGSSGVVPVVELFDSSGQS